MATHCRGVTVSLVRVLAPAKVNLGLAILGKRADGYHEIDTVMAMIDLCDEITISPGNGDDVTIDGMDDVPVESNLMTQAARLWSDAAGRNPTWHIRINKRIPSPAGVGGGSSDAAAVLMALNTLSGHPLSSEHLHDLAAQIGADCPFFLNGSCARATGTGTSLRAISPPSGWVVLAVSHESIPAKTAALYGALTPDHYGDSASIDKIESRMGRGTLTGTKMPNSFLHPALHTFLTLPRLREEFLTVADNASLSGAGPAMFAIAPFRDQANHWASELRERTTPNITIHIAEFLQSRPEPVILS